MSFFFGNYGKKCFMCLSVFLLLHHRLLLKDFFRDLYHDLCHNLYHFQKLWWKIQNLLQFDDCSREESTFLLFQLIFVNVECDNDFFKRNSSRSWNCSIIVLIASNFLEIDLCNFETSLKSIIFSLKCLISTAMLDSLPK